MQAPLSIAKDSTVVKGKHAGNKVVLLLSFHSCAATMEAFLMVVTLTLVWGPVHLYLTKTDVAGVRRWISSMMKQQEHEDPLKEARAEEEMLGLIGMSDFC